MVIFKKKQKKNLRDIQISKHERKILTLTKSWPRTCILNRLYKWIELTLIVPIFTMFYFVNKIIISMRIL